MPSPLISVARDLVIFLVLVNKGDILTTGDFLYKCECFLQKRNSYLVFRVSPCFLENNQLKIMIMPQRLTLSWQILLPYNLFVDLQPPKLTLCLDFWPAMPWSISIHSMQSKTGFTSLWVLSQNTPPSQRAGEASFITFSK